MTYPTVLPRPPYLSDFHGSVRVRIRYDNRDMCTQQACGPVELPEGIPVPPLVTFEALGNNGRKLFPVQVWDYTGDGGRGAWAIFREDEHPVPESKPEVEPETEVAFKPTASVSVSRPDVETDDEVEDEDAPVVEDRVEDDD